MPRPKTAKNVDLGSARPTHRAPLQARSQKTLERILDATEALLEDRIFEDLTVQDILRKAKVSTGSFYARFATKDDVLRDLYRRYREGLDDLKAEVPREKTDGLPLVEVVERLVTRTLERMEGRRGLIRTIALHMRQHPEASGEAERRAARDARDAGVEMLVRRKAEFSHANPREAARFVIFTLAAQAREFVLFGYTPHASQLRLSRKKFIRETTRMLTSYLGVK